MISVHFEAVVHLHRTLTAIRDLGAVRCRSQSTTPIGSLEEACFRRYVLVMSSIRDLGAIVQGTSLKESRLRSMIDFAA